MMVDVIIARKVVGWMSLSLVKTSDNRGIVKLNDEAVVKVGDLNRLIKWAKDKGFKFYEEA